MKKIIAFVLAALMMLAFCSCSGKGNTKPESQTDNTVESDAAAEEEVNYEQAYAEKLDEIYEIVLRNAEKDETLSDEGHENLIGIFECSRYIDVLDNIGYIMKDVNDDEIPELIVGADEGNHGTRILNVFACRDGKAVSVLEGWYRNAWYMLESGEFFNYGSGGAAYLINGLYVFSEDTELECEDMYFTAPDGVSDEGLMYLHNPNGLADENDSASEQITEEEFYSFSESCSADEIALDLTPISRCGFPEIKVEFLDEAEVKPDDFESYAAESQEGAVKLLFTAEEEVKELTICSMMVEDIDEDGEMSYSVSKLKTFSPLQKSLVAEVCFYGDLPNNAFSVTDKYGNDIYYAVNLSGEDGSVVTYRFFNPTVV